MTDYDARLAHFSHTYPRIAFAFLLIAEIDRQQTHGRLGSGAFGTPSPSELTPIWWTPA
jgi:hypothetical protein